MRFADPAYADTIANRYLDLALAHGTTSMCTYATIHPASVDAFFTAARNPQPARLCRQDLHGPQRPRRPM